MTFTGWLPAFLGTLATEVPVYVWTLRASLGFRRAVLTALALNVVTHPLAWTVIARAPLPFPGGFLAIEASVWAVEASVLKLLSHSRWARRRLSWPEALAMSLAANGLSAGTGLLL